MKDVGSSPVGAAFDFDSFVRKLTENCQRTSSHENRKLLENSADFKIFSLHRRNSSD
jgi:hypothetical protein